MKKKPWQATLSEKIYMNRELNKKILKLKRSIDQMIRILNDEKPHRK
jgi:hypothetical protein